MITSEKLKIYDTYRGDSDGMGRMGRSWEYDLFEEGEWATIEKMYQDVQVINKRHTSVSYTDQAIKTIWEKCDYTSAKKLVAELSFYEGFQMVVGFLQMMKEYAQKEGTVWTGFGTADAFLAEIDYLRERLRFCDFVVLEQVNVDLSHSGIYHEIFRSTNREVLYLNLRKDFDRLYKQITGNP